ncbi:MAG: hypothetical protein ACRC5M_05970 [Anaeroplasmataceae bacterium]
MVKKNIWNQKKIFRTEVSNNKSNCFFTNNFVKTNINGFTNKTIYPYFVNDIFNKYNRYINNGTNFTIGYNDIEYEVYNFSYKHTTRYNELWTFFSNDLNNIGICFDERKEVKVTDNEYINFVQNVFINLYKKNIITYKKDKILTDFDSNVFYNEFDTYKENSSFYSKENNDILSYKNESFCSLNLSGFEDSLYKNILNITMDEKIKKDTLDFFGFYETLSINIFDNLNQKELVLNLEFPELICGINFIFMNPDFIDIYEYTALEELDSIKKDYESKFSGIIFKNPFNNEDIYLFFSKKYNQAIHIGIPSISDEDFLFAKNNGINVSDCLEEDIIINSDYLSGLTREEARLKIIEDFTLEDVGQVRMMTKLKNIVITSNEPFGLLAPIGKDLEHNICVYDFNNTPIRFINATKIHINNDNDLDIKMLNKVMLPLFYNGLNFIYNYTYDKLQSNLDVLNKKNTISKLNINSTFINTTSLSNICLTIFLTTILCDISNSSFCIDNIINYDNLNIEQSFIEEYQRLNLSFSKQVILNSNPDLYRIYLLLNSTKLLDDLKQTIVEVNKYENVLTNIKKIYNKNLDNDSKFSLKIDCICLNKFLDSFDVNNYAIKLMELIDRLTNIKLTKKEAFKLLKYISIICPFISEEINNTVFNNKESIFNYDLL